MLHIPISRWGEPYKSLELEKVVHFARGEVLAEVSRANGGLVERDILVARQRRKEQAIPLEEVKKSLRDKGKLP